MDLLVKVQEHHIAEGCRGNAWTCPVALALKEAYPALAWRVDYKSIEGFEPKLPLHRVFIPIPNKVAGWAREFDLNTKVEPFEFLISIPPVETFEVAP